MYLLFPIIAPLKCWYRKVGVMWFRGGIFLLFVLLTQYVNSFDIFRPDPGWIVQCGGHDATSHIGTSYMTMWGLLFCKVMIFICHSVQLLLPPARFLKNDGRYCFDVRRSLCRLCGCFALYLGCYFRASFLKFAMFNICKNTIPKMFLDYVKIWNCLFDRGFFNFW